MAYPDENDVTEETKFTASDEPKQVDESSTSAPVEEPAAAIVASPEDAEVARLRGLLAAVMNNPDLPAPIAAMIGEELRK